MTRPSRVARTGIQIAATAMTRSSSAAGSQGVNTIPAPRLRKSAGAAVLLFTSELPEIPLACDRALILFGGRVVREMPAAEADEGTLLRAAHGLVETAEMRP